MTNLSQHGVPGPCRNLLHDMSSTWRQGAAITWSAWRGGTMPSYADVHDCILPVRHAGTKNFNGMIVYLGEKFPCVMSSDPGEWLLDGCRGGLLLRLIWGCGTCENLILAGDWAALAYDRKAAWLGWSPGTGHLPHMYMSFWRTRMNSEFFEWTFESYHEKSEIFC